MGEAKEFDLGKPAPVIDDEDEARLAAIDEGIHDAKAGRTVPMEKVRKLLPLWITASTSPNELNDLAEIIRIILWEQGPQY